MSKAAPVFKFKTPEERAAEQALAKRGIALETGYDNPPDFDALFGSSELDAIDALLDEAHRDAAKQKCGSAQWRGIRENIDRLEAARDAAIAKAEGRS